MSLREYFFDADPTVPVRENPEEQLASYLFSLGLLAEAGTVAYGVAFGKNVVRNGDGIPFYLAMSGFQIVVYSLTLLSLLIHQVLTRNAFRKIDQIRSQGRKLFFPRGEYLFRNAYFVLLAVLVGEIPYLLIVTHQLILRIFYPESHFSIMTYLTPFIILTCFLLATVTCAWNAILLMAKKTVGSKHGDTPEENLYGQWEFVFCDLLSVILWAFILIFIFTNSFAWIEVGLMAFAGLYVVVIIGFRVFLQGSRVKVYGF